MKKEQIPNPVALIAGIVPQLAPDTDEFAEVVRICFEAAGGTRPEAEKALADYRQSLTPPNTTDPACGV